MKLATLLLFLFVVDNLHVINCILYQILVILISSVDSNSSVCHALTVHYLYFNIHHIHIMNIWYDLPYMDVFYQNLHYLFSS